MRKVTVNRPQKIVLPFSKGKILLDGNEIGIVKAGKSATFEVSDGNHDVQLVFKAIPPVSSNVLYIDSSDGDTNIEVKITVPVSGDETYAELTKK
jgi:hypothetical protein